MNPSPSNAAARFTARRWSASVPGTSSNTEESRAFFQKRISVFCLCVLVIGAAFYLVSLVAEIATNPAFDLLERTTHSRTLYHFLAIVVAGGVWLMVRRGSWSANMLSWLDGGSLVVLATLMALIGIEEDLFAQQTRFSIVLAVTNTILARAIIVPSTAQRTLILSTVACIPVLLVHIYMHSKHSSLSAAAPFLVGSFVKTACWCAVAIAIATVGSRTIFGLQREVRKMHRLGQYALERQIGAGAMGVVFEASHAMLRRPTAVKLLHPWHEGDQTLHRFEREVQMTAQLTHPNTVAIYDYGHTPDGSFYYAMEFLDGVDLEKLVSVDGPQDSARVVYILAQVCGALSEAHEAKMVHRDIKPANIILCQRGGRYDVAKVVDFGLVKTSNVYPEDPALTHINTLTGTPLYLAPESITTPTQVDGRSDIYALAATGYFLLTGCPVFDGDTVVEVCGHHLHTIPQRPSQRVQSEIPAQLEDILLSCLAKDPKDRPQTAEQLQGQLEQCEEGKTWSQQQAKDWWLTYRDKS